MSVSTVLAYLDDGPHAGEVVRVDAGPDDAPPQQVVISDPVEPAKESVEVGATLHGVTTYHLHGPATARNTYIYRTGDPVD
jgi:hypothetical protein